MIRQTDGSLHYTINGEDQGVACENIPLNVYAVIDLYGQCAQVSVVHHLNLAAGVAPNLIQSHHRLIHENNSLASSQVSKIITCKFFFGKSDKISFRSWNHLM